MTSKRERDDPRARFRVTCTECGEIAADTHDGLYSRDAAHRRAGFHEGTEGNDPPHYVSVTVSPNTVPIYNPEGDA